MTLCQHTTLCSIAVLPPGSVGTWVVTVHLHFVSIYAQIAHPHIDQIVATSALISHELSMSSIQTLAAALITLQTGCLSCRRTLK